MRVTYSILNPTGNLTALVETPVEETRQPSLAAALMEHCPEVEQVGFLSPGTLRMAGGEFCGNASMSAAALFLLRGGRGEGRDPERVHLRVSGAGDPVEVRLWRESSCSFRAGVRMPRPLDLTERAFSFGTAAGVLPFARMEGISHLLVESGSPFFGLLEDRAAAGQAVRQWCGELSAQGLGLMFLGEDGRLIPLVYGPGSGTLFWENSCASGTSVAGMLLAQRRGEPVSLVLTEPGGELRVESTPGGDTWLYGRVELVEQNSLDL